MYTHILKNAQMQAGRNAKKKKMRVCGFTRYFIRVT